MLQNKIATAQPVKVVAVDTQGAQGPTGYVDVLPLVTYVDGKGQAVQPVTLYHLPYSRIQGGKAALIIDPVPDDIGVAVFANLIAVMLQQGQQNHNNQVAYVNIASLMVFILVVS